jgi:hypothetical protein
MFLMRFLNIFLSDDVMYMLIMHALDPSGCDLTPI